ncbi:YwpF family protein [Falsibacillus pallidus]|uniref:YwpF-like protein n=1 Tax=Falsibacillus pallidus TaxID=493781 RepID=A0A370GCS6_9BACI|nr:YwpF family protein [Falsibacillus pallidus]RDI41625.1 YwpF-like protein [Falsibacillus pallidus]
MKTFKLITLQIADNGDFSEYPLIDGLIINKENERRTWLVEAFVEERYLEPFQAMERAGEDLDVQVVISHPANDPAFLSMHVSNIKKIGNKLSILMEGTIKKPRSEYAELLLTDLMEKGFTGGELLQEFKDKMETKPKIPKKVNQ